MTCPVADGIGAVLEQHVDDRKLVRSDRVAERSALAVVAGNVCAFIDDVGMRIEQRS